VARQDEADRRQRRAIVLRAGAVALLLVTSAVSLLTPTSASGGASVSAAVAASSHIGHLTVVNAFLPLPTSPNVALIYLTVTNSGSRPGALVSVSTPDALGAMLMTVNRNGSMTFLRDLAIPAHGQASLVPGKSHLMLELPKTRIRLGQRVTVTLRFLRAGLLTLKVPVVPLKCTVRS
jgi:periplasmic copper chaperone A